MKKKYVIIGAGGRAFNMFARPIVTELQEYAELVGICDTNPLRASAMNEMLGGHIECFSDFDDMLEQCQPDAVIVTTIDSVHHEYIIRSLNAGYDVISEKPMTIDTAKCITILEAEHRTGKKVSVTFNMRFLPYVARIKELLVADTIGDIQSANVEWSLDKRHGADYFRRWHRRMEYSGGLLLHKSTHHFDMVNWWLDDEPETVFAFGDLQYYGPTRDERSERCYTCEYQNKCEFYYNIAASEFTKGLYLNSEKHDGYFRDRCVFSPEIDIYDTMSVITKYKRGAQLTYSLTAYNAYEGWKATLVGSKGRIEARIYSSGPESNHLHDEIIVYDSNNKQSIIEVMKQNEAEHGGSDAALRRMLFIGDVDDSLKQQADSWAGTMSLMIGAAANISIVQLKPVSIMKLLEVDRLKSTIPLKLPNLVNKT